LTWWESVKIISITSKDQLLKMTQASGYYCFLNVLSEDNTIIDDMGVFGPTIGLEQMSEIMEIRQRWHVKGSLTWDAVNQIGHVTRSVSGSSIIGLIKQALNEDYRKNWHLGGSGGQPKPALKVQVEKKAVRPKRTKPQTQISAKGGKTQHKLRSGQLQRRHYVKGVSESEGSFLQNRLYCEASVVIRPPVINNTEEVQAMAELECAAALSPYTIALPPITMGERDNWGIYSMPEPIPKVKGVGLSYWHIEAPPQVGQPKVIEKARPRYGFNDRGEKTRIWDMTLGQSIRKPRSRKRAERRKMVGSKKLALDCFRNGQYGWLPDTWTYPGTNVKVVRAARESSAVILRRFKTLDALVNAWYQKKEANLNPGRHPLAGPISLPSRTVKSLPFDHEKDAIKFGVDLAGMQSVDNEYLSTYNSIVRSLATIANRSKSRICGSRWLFSPEEIKTQISQVRKGPSQEELNHETHASNGNISFIEWIGGSNAVV
jgi:hypothetical protein